jgi:2-polyprenyl-3-methyl-5-hydroxy-6-metoxy-1,4-benzoquinol methylase
MFGSDEYKRLNQDNYKEKASDHGTLSLDATLYLAYRDVGELLSRHLYGNRKKTDTIKILDFGCGAGLSTQIFSNKINQDAGFKISVTGVDVSAENLALAREKLPTADFKLIVPGDKLNDLEKFDLIVCNFVLVEMESKDMTEVLRILNSKLSENGILIVTNTTAQLYRPENSWYTFNTQFPENKPTRVSDDHSKLKYYEDQPIKVQVFANKERTQSFTFSDHFHSGSAYRTAYNTAGLKLLEMHKPIGKVEDKIEWESEKDTPPYKIHVLRK